ncbi:MAG: hypothetical protein F6K32_11540 [Desertifilum sp. SIO1I2]|nr:hypothetical protein [Desertifilum sp. SIO1I2]
MTYATITTTQECLDKFAQANLSERHPAENPPTQPQRPTLIQRLRPSIKR